MASKINPEISGDENDPIFNFDAPMHFDFATMREENDPEQWFEGKSSKSDQINPNQTHVQVPAELDTKIVESVQMRPRSPGKAEIVQQPKQLQSVTPAKKPAIRQTKKPQNPNKDNKPTISKGKLLANHKSRKVADKSSAPPLVAVVPTMNIIAIPQDEVKDSLSLPTTTLPTESQIGSKGKRKLTVPKSPRFITRNREKKLKTLESTEEKQLKEIRFVQIMKQKKLQKIKNAPSTSESTTIVHSSFPTKPSTATSAVPQTSKSKPESSKATSSKRATTAPSVSSRVHKSSTSAVDRLSRPKRDTETNRMETRASTRRTSLRVDMKKHKTLERKVQAKKIVTALSSTTNLNPRTTRTEMIRAQKRALAKSMDKPEDHYSYQFKALELNESILRGPPKGVPILPITKLTLPNSPMLRTKSRSQLKQDVPTKHELLQSKIQEKENRENELQLNESQGVKQKQKQKKLTSPHSPNLRTSTRAAWK